MNWTFGVPTDGNQNSEYIDRLINSIKSQFKDNYEIIFCTENEAFNTENDNIRTIYIGRDRPGWITKKKNEIAKIAKYENICFLHDYFFLEDNWATSFDDFKEDWNVCTTKILDPSDIRLMDWASLDGRYGHACIPYDVQDVKENMYVPGNVFCVKKDFMLANPLDENLGHWGGEDLEWSRRIRGFYKFFINTGAVTRSQKDKPDFRVYSRGL